MKTFTKHHLLQAAALRKPGYLDAVLEKAIQTKSGHYQLADEHFDAIRKQFGDGKHPTLAGFPAALKSGIALGTCVQKLLSPFVSFIDGMFGTNFKGCSACQRRADRLNQIGWHITAIFRNIAAIFRLACFWRPLRGVPAPPSPP